MGKLCKNQLVGKLAAIVVAVLLVGGGVTFTATAQADETLVQKLVTLFRGHAQTEIDNAVMQAKSQLAAETKETRRNNLEKLFDNQIATLKDRGVPQQILGMLQDQKNTVVTKASNMTIGAGNTPFIPVIKPSYLGYYGLMSLVRNGAKEGYSYLNPALITDKMETPNGLYYIYDVEDGEAMRGKSPEAAEKLLKEQRRSPLTAAEVLALATHTDVLSRHFVDATGSRYGSGDVPFLWLDGGLPGLDYGWADFAISEWGSASCGSR